MKQHFKFENSLLDMPIVIDTCMKIDEYSNYLAKVINEKEYSTDEASIVLPFDSEIAQKVFTLAETISTTELRYIFVIGVGGSNLGTYAIYEALGGYLKETRSIAESFPKIIFLDTIKPELFSEIEKIITIDEEIAKPEHFLINVISKSGSTTETIANFEMLYELISKNVGYDFNDRIVVTTDFESKLWNSSVERGFHLLEIPKKVGGRFSVFAAVGLFPLYLVFKQDKEQILMLLKGARDAAVASTGISSNNNAMISAVGIYLHYKQGISIKNHFFFAPQLEYVGKWYIQLMGESIGKKYDADGNEVCVGITPITSIGTTDLHSLAQLFFGGPKDKLTTLVSFKRNRVDISVPKSLVLGNLVEGINGRSDDFLLNAIYDGVKIAYISNKLPFLEIQLDNLSPYSIGYFLQFKMIEIMYLAKLLNVNAFDQPNVEDYKMVAREYMRSRGNT